MIVFNPILEINRRKMVALLTDFHTGEGLLPTVLDGVKLGRSTCTHPCSPVLYEPSIYIVASGRKTGIAGDLRFVYDPNNYLVLSVPLPFECQTEVGENNEPMLGISIRMETGIISELAVKMESGFRTDTVQDFSCVRATPIDIAMSDVTLRLLQCLKSPTEATILGPGIIREITYRTLCGPQGYTLLNMIGRTGHLAQIHAVLNRMHSHYAEPFNVTELAEEVGMSISAFHHNFKMVTSSSPLQYLKSIRLHKARMLMFQSGIGAAIAADKVGYESASQFSREFKRFFGTSPMEESRRMKDTLAIPSPKEPAATTV